MNKVVLSKIDTTWSTDQCIVYLPASLTCSVCLSVYIYVRIGPHTHTSALQSLSRRLCASAVRHLTANVKSLIKNGLPCVKKNIDIVNYYNNSSP